MLACYAWLIGLCLLALTSIGNAYKSLSDDTIIHHLPKPVTSDFNIHGGSILSPILIPRVSGTEGSRKVLQHFVDYFKTSLPEWTIELQNSTSKTPTHGTQDVPFVNFIARREPPWATPGGVSYLTLVAHYDSKYQPKNFIGATDSAAPCAMIMHAVRAIDTTLTKKWSDMQATGADNDLEEDAIRGIQVLFLDGEEAFQSWTNTDSIYGARSLAEEWEHAMYPAASTFKNKLTSIDMFVLLDLLGSPEDTPIPSWMQNTHWAYQKLASMEEKLRKMGLFKSNSKHVWLPDKDKPHNAQFESYYMQDDHIPFVARGVPILHLIPNRFPSVWHTMNDDADHLDINAVEDWSLLTSAFAAEYMELEGYFETNSKLHKRGEVVTSKTEL